MKLEGVSATLAQLAEARAAVAPQDVTMSSASPTVVPLAVPKAEIKKKLQVLETSLAALPPDDEDFQFERDTLRAKIASIKRGAIDLQPIGARIDGTRDALQRALKRKQEADSALAAARALVEESEIEVKGLEQELSQLEAALAQPSTADVDSPQEAQPVEVLAKQLNSFLEGIRADAHVDPSHLAEATDHVARLINGLRGTLQYAEASALAAQQPESLPRQRIVGKQVPAQTSCASKIVCNLPPTHRVLGKQPAKKVITDYFRKSTKRTTLLAADGNAGKRRSCGDQSDL